MNYSTIKTPDIGHICKHTSNLPITMVTQNGRLDKLGKNPLPAEKNVRKPQIPQSRIYVVLHQKNYWSFGNLKSKGIKFTVTTYSHHTTGVLLLSTYIFD